MLMRIVVVLLSSDHALKQLALSPEKTSIDENMCGGGTLNTETEDAKKGDSSHIIS